MLPALRNNSTVATTDRPVNRLANIFDQVFGPMDRFFDWDADPFAAAWGGIPATMWDDEDAVHVEVELPGVEEKDIDVSVHGDRLVIKAERKAEEGRKYLYRGRSYGRYEQVISLPQEVQSEAAEAKLSNGVLRLTLPKVPEAKPKKIAVRAE